MAQSILDTLQSLTTSDFVRTTARQLGESEDAVATALSGAGAVLLARLAQLSGDGPVMTRVAGLIEPVRNNEWQEFTGEDDPRGYSRPPLAEPVTPERSALKLGRGTALLNVVVGPRLLGLVDGLAGHAAISPTSARAVIGHAAPLVLKALGVRLDHLTLDPVGLAPTGRQLADLLSREREILGRSVPLPF